MRLAPGPLLWNLAGSLAVLLALGGLAVGLPAVDRAIPAERPVTAGQPYPVGAGVTVVPPAGSMLEVTRTRPGNDRGSALFVLGGVRYLVVVAPSGGDLRAAAARLRAKVTETPGYQVAGTESPVSTGAGLPGLQGGYTAPGRAGRYAVFLLGDLAVEITASGTDLELGRSLPAIEASTRSIARRSTR